MADTFPNPENTNSGLPSEVHESASGFSNPVGETAEVKTTTTSRAVVHGGEMVDLQGQDDFVIIDNFGEEAAYPLNNHDRTPAGHVIERNDTPGSERILLKHNSGKTLINMCPDGELVIKSASRVEVINGDHSFTAGNGQLTYKGNLTLNVQGDYTLNVDGEYKVTSSDRTDTVNGPFTTTVFGNKSDIIEGNVARQATGITTQTSLSGYNNFVKGISRHVSTGNMSHNTSAEMDVTANTKMGIASADINLAATNLSVFGSTGTIGGESIVYYGNTAHIPRVNSTSMHATTFHGTLEGNAKTATQAGSAGTAGSLGAGGSAGTHTVDTAANSTTAQPTAANVSSYLTKYAVKRVEIDPSDVLLGFINLSVKQGGISNKPLTEKEVRTRMCEHSTNKTFTAFQLANGKLNAEFTNTTPTNTGRIRNAKKFTGTGSRPINITHLESTAKRLLIENVPMLKFAMPPELQLQLASGITSATILTKHIRMGRFLSAEGSKTTLPQIIKAGVDTQQLARNLSVSANILQAFNDNTSDFLGFELVVSDGVYVPYKDETLTADGPLDKAKSGKRVGFEVRGDGVMDLEATYEAANWINQTLPFEKLTLAYDRYGPKLHARIIVETNDVPTNYVADFAKKVETTYNDKVQATNEFIEVKAEPEEYPELI